LTLPLLRAYTQGKEKRMSTQVILKLSDDLYENARRWAALTDRDVVETLTSALEIVLTSVPSLPEVEKPVSSLSDAEVLALSQAKMKTWQGQRLGELLDKQREEKLTDQERPELLALMQLYNQLWVRQSEALLEAVNRGLRPPLKP
jgi:hypothetical protein